MAESRRLEQRFLDKDERELVAATHHPELAGLDDATLKETVKRLRERRDRATDVARRQRREMRGKARPAGAAAAADDSGSRRKKQLLAAALKRANKEATRRRGAAQRDPARRALAAKQAAKRPARPAPGRTAGQGMRATKRATAPSGALDAEGHRPVLERSRKVR